MIAMFDSKIGKLTKRGQNHGNERLWVVQVRAADLTDVLTFKPNKKLFISELADVIDAYLIEAGVTTGRVRWTATAR